MSIEWKPTVSAAVYVLFVEVEKDLLELIIVQLLDGTTFLDDDDEGIIREFERLWLILTAELVGTLLHLFVLGLT